MLGEDDDCYENREVRSIIPGDNDRDWTTNEPPYLPGQSPGLSRIPAQPGPVPVIPPVSAPV